MLGVKKLNIIEVDCRCELGSYTYCDSSKLEEIAENYFLKGE
jgi:hypothetical protein